MKLAFIDVETTGTDADKNGIHQISGILEVDGETVDEFDFKVQPFSDDAVDLVALQVSGIEEATFKTYPQPVLVKRDFEKRLSQHVDKFNKLDKFQFIAYSANFDSQFIRSWFQKQGDLYYGSWFWHPPIDVMALAASHLMESRHHLANFKLATVANAMGLQVETGKLHDALYDIRLTRELFNLVRPKVAA